MKTFGIKVSAEQIAKNLHWEGYWQYKDGKKVFKFTTTIIRKSRYDAERDAVQSAKSFSENNNMIFITEGYII